jgi:hypothetical protein
MRYSRVWTDQSNESRVEWLEPQFRDIENYAQGVPTLGITESRKAGVTHLVRFPAGWTGDWHPAPVRQMWVLLQGKLGAETGDGAIEEGPGAFGLLEDTEGRGHRSWVVGDQDAIVLMVTLPEGD